MNREEIIDLIDDLALAALNYDLARNNLKKWEEIYEKLLNEFNNSIEHLDGEILSDDEFNKKVERIKDIFDSLESN